MTDLDRIPAPEPERPPAHQPAPGGFPSPPALPGAGIPFRCLVPEQDRNVVWVEFPIDELAERVAELIAERMCGK